MKVGELIRKIRKREGLTQTLLAERCRITKSRICEIEKSYRGDDLRLSTLILILNGLNIPISQFFYQYDLSNYNIKSNENRQRADATDVG